MDALLLQIYFVVVVVAVAVSVGFVMMALGRCLKISFSLITPITL
jgi:hypothetical protein